MRASMAAVGAWMSGCSTQSPRFDEVFRQTRTDDVQGNSLAGFGLRRPVLGVQAPTTQLQALRREQQSVIDRDTARDQRAGDDEAGAGHDESAVHREARISVGGTLTRSQRL